MLYTGLFRPIAYRLRFVFPSPVVSFAFSLLDLVDSSCIYYPYIIRQRSYLRGVLQFSNEKFHTARTEPFGSFRDRRIWTWQTLRGLFVSSHQVLQAKGRLDYSIGLITGHHYPTSHPHAMSTASPR